MPSKHDILTPEERHRLLDALKGIREKIQWKPGKEITHLRKRQKMVHIDPSSTLSDYNGIISDLVKQERNLLYIYEFNGIYYYAVRGFVNEKEWLVIFGAGGMMETAFPPEKIDDYLSHRGFIFFDRIEEILRWTG
jgi:hypothetical protein